jgi:protein-tyrosine-phosphatase
VTAAFEYGYCSHLLLAIVMTILFVCSGNTCRSPLAVAAWRVLNASATSPAQGLDPIGNIEVISAGLAAAEGAPASPHAVAVACDWGVDLSLHRARSLSESLVRTADLICTMTTSQAAAVSTYFSTAKNVHVLGEFSRFCGEARERRNPEEERLALLLEDTTTHKLCDAGNCDIFDPYGGSLEAYRSCANQIRRAVAGLAAALRQGQVHLT